MIKMAGGNDDNLSWRMNFSRQVFLLRIITMLVYQTFKLSYVRLRRRQERWYRETVNRTEKYSRWRSRRNQRMIQSLISELSRPRTVVRSVWSRERCGSWWRIIVEGGFREEDWISNFRMSYKLLTFYAKSLSPIWREKTLDFDKQ